ncbi:MAG: hypothetical protein GC158_11125 [Cyanobacteria bacterium RI_101]|nr:hypothetical protein [Cyanobacteria bacterium RI_101]
MAYSDFTLSAAVKAFGLEIREEEGLFESVPQQAPSVSLEETLKENLSLALASNTEKSRSEMIIAPVLVDLRRQLGHRISLFSGINFSVDPSQGLNGNCDFLISQSSELLVLKAPIVTLVEAKKEDLNGGLGQCVAEMVAAQYFNRQEGNVIPVIYGAVTSGTVWKFLKLINNQVFIDLKEYYLDNLGQILGILVSAIEGVNAPLK